MDQNNDVFDVANQEQLILHRCIPTSTRGMTVAIENFAEQVGPGAIQEQSRLMDNGFENTSEITSLFHQSTKLFVVRNNQSILHTYLDFTRRCNLMPTDVTASFKRSIIASLKLADTAKIYRALHDEGPVTGLEHFEVSPSNVYGDYSEWEKVLQPLEFDEEITKEFLYGAESSFGHKLPTIKHVLDSLQQVNVSVSGLSITDLLKIYLLVNLKNVSSRVAMQSFFSDKMPATFDAVDSAFVFTGCMADVRFSPQQFTEDMCWFMRNVQVADSFQHDVAYFIHNSNILQHKNSVELVSERKAGRVRLRDRLSMNSVLQAPVDRPVSQLEEDSLQGWALRARVPPAISHKHKLFGYVLMSQRKFADPSQALAKHFANDLEVHANMLTQCVCKPHASAIIEFIRLITAHVTPFDELIQFRDECFSDFSHTDAKDLSWQRLLQLYVAAYQHEDVWSTVWKSFCSVLSHQVLLSVGNFKRTHEYAVDKVAAECMRT
jgi:hypothetical protein